jgi:hypothetical protein
VIPRMFTMNNLDIVLEELGWGANQRPHFWANLGGQLVRILIDEQLLQLKHGMKHVSM